MGHAAPAPRGYQGVQEVLTDEAADEARSSGEAEPESKRQKGFWHRRGRVKGFWHSFGTVGATMGDFGVEDSEEAFCFLEVSGATRRDRTGDLLITKQARDRK